MRAIIVEAGAVVGRLDADDLRAQLQAAEAQIVQAQRAVDQSRAGVRKSRVRRVAGRQDAEALRGIWLVGVSSAAASSM